MTREMSPAYRLINACRTSRAAAESLLDDEPDLLTARTGIGETALHYLAVEDEREAVLWLLSRGASIDPRNDFGGTPLMDAASLGYEEMVRLLLASGADPNAQDPSNESALTWAARNGETRVAEILLDAGAATETGLETPLHCAAGNGHVALVKLLLTRGARIEAPGFLAWTALHYAAEHGHDAVVDVLLESGADRCARDSEGRVPADLAGELGLRQLAEKLRCSRSDDTTRA